MGDTPAKGGLSDNVLKIGGGIALGAIGLAIGYNILFGSSTNTYRPPQALDPLTGSGLQTVLHGGGQRQPTPQWMNGQPFVPQGGKPPAAPSGYHWNPFQKPVPTADTGCKIGEMRFNPATQRMQACGPP